MNTKRSRLSPEARREQLLDVAKQSILETGLQQFSLKQMAVDAGVSEPLLFHYFASRVDLLQQLLKRDFLRKIGSLNSALEGAQNLDEILHIYISRNFDQFAEESVIDILLSDPEVARAITEHRTQNARKWEKIVVEKIAKTLELSQKKAVVIALMASSASIAAARYARDTEMSRDDFITIVTEFVTAGFESQRNN